MRHMHTRTELTLVLALSAALALGTGGTASADPAPEANCIALAGAHDRTVYVPVGQQISAIAQNPGAYVPGAESIGEILVPLATGEFPCPF